MSRQGPSRRQFGLAVAAGAVPAALGAQEKKPDKPPRTSLDESADALLALIVARHGKHLDEDQRKRLRGRIVASLSSGQRLRKSKLTNADEPAFLFSADLAV